MSFTAHAESQWPSQSWTRTQIARVTRNSLVAHGISLACILLILWLSSSYLTHFFRGPIRPTDQQLTTIIADRGNRSLIAYVELLDRQLIETDWQEVSTSDGRPYSTVPFFLMPVGDQYLLVLARSAADGRHLIGPIGPLRDMDAKVIEATVRRHPELQGKILPVMMSSVAAFTIWGYVLLTLLIPWSAWTFFRLARTIMARFNPDIHPVARQFALADPLGDASANLPSIDHEMKSGPTLNLGKATLTESWFVRPTTFGMKSLRLDQIVWVYHLRQQYESFVVFALRNGKLFPIPLKDAAIPQVIDFVGQRFPWVLRGYDDERLKLWKRDPREIIALVDARRSAANDG
ncbi:MAG: hypothetical protein U1A77_10195 [Pirellulales bacterium]